MGLNAKLTYTVNRVPQNYSVSRYTQWPVGIAVGGTYKHKTVNIKKLNAISKRGSRHLHSPNLFSRKIKTNLGN